MPQLALVGISFSYECVLYWYTVDISAITCRYAVCAVWMTVICELNQYHSAFICVLAGVGKTSLILSLVSEEFPDEVIY
jgi:hypothetical protein